jgi:nicotinamidase-related amidase
MIVYLKESNMTVHFKPETSALVLIDYQVGTMQLIKNQFPDTALRNAVALARAALAFDMPIVLTASQEDHIQGPTSEALKHVCLVFPAISAVKEGYEVLAVMDACGSPFEISENVSWRRMERSGVWLTATNPMIADLVQDWSSPQGQKLIPTIFASSPIRAMD